MIDFANFPFVTSLQIRVRNASEERKWICSVFTQSAALLAVASDKLFHALVCVPMA